jgi:hypothetical protein
MAFLLLSYLILPAQKTRSHYLSVCLIVSIMMIAIGFTIPLGSKPQQCHNEITPNDMYSSLECAFSGAFVVAGGLSVVVWILIRALSMNLQICWDIVPGNKFFYASQALGWGVSATLFSLTIALTGVSFRMGDTCHVNHQHAMGVFWGPLLFMAGAAGILQLGTFIYCINVYLKNLWTEQNGHHHNPSSGTPGSIKKGLPSYQSSSGSSQRGSTARAVYQRLKKVLWLQWRGLFIVTIILVDVVYFSVIFVWLDSQQTTIGQDWNEVGPWIICMIQDPTAKGRNHCMPLIQPFLVSEGVLVSVLMLLSVAGMQCFLLLARPSLFSAWWTLLRKGPSSAAQQPEFIDLDAAAAAASRPGLAGRSMSAQKPLLPSHSRHEEARSASALGISSAGKLSPQVAVVTIPDNNWPLKSDSASPSMRNSIQSVESGISAETRRQYQQSQNASNSQSPAITPRSALAPSPSLFVPREYSPQPAPNTTASPNLTLSPQSRQHRPAHTSPPLRSPSTAGSTPPLSSLQAFQQISNDTNTNNTNEGGTGPNMINHPSISSPPTPSLTPSSPERDTRSSSPVPPQTLYQRQQLQRHLQQREEWRLQQQQQQGHQLLR